MGMKVSNFQSINSKTHTDRKNNPLTTPKMVTLYENSVIYRPQHYCKNYLKIISLTRNLTLYNASYCEFWICIIT